MGFKIGIYDWLAFLVLIGLLLSVCWLVWYLLGLPGRIAIARNHPDADAVSTMGWLGFLGGVSWVAALIWAFRPTYPVDIRYLPKEEQEHIARQIALLRGERPSAPPPTRPDVIESESSK
ncbi:MAG: DUF3302 domain-containing protein [Candidatus Eremiobacteraeota bacterium]|nr:DUF3302 domain-containing protein [Candidatus Eremiobacteraeota bacterium]MBV8460163.1 DUF3302 domain-containing protein [Candidatus Eremiobacteraeota bacterium]MBV8596442.1 DUF3302 domain-containing protein [Candidatus Eremiobacteraeota bacterium]MBV8667591.1 DUF3302 domain-containing protein [Candidatus Eremiobacteraeota bacterium]